MARSRAGRDLPGLHGCAELRQLLAHGRVVFERLLQPGVDALPHPRQRLALAPRVERAIGHLQRLKFAHSRPQGVNALAMQCARCDDPGLPVRRALRARRNLWGRGRGWGVGWLCICVNWRAELICAWARVAASASMSALLMSTRSASSSTPFLMACRSSPALGNCISTSMSVMPATATSLWPTPTVSTMTMS